jgi:hypothetical protein
MKRGFAQIFRNRSQTCLVWKMTIALFTTRWHEQPPLKSAFYTLVVSIKSSSTWVILLASQRETFFYFYVESPPSSLCTTYESIVVILSSMCMVPKLLLIESWMCYYLFLNYLYLVILWTLKVHVTSKIILFITYLLEDEQELSLGMLIRRKRIYNFWCSMFVLHQLLYFLSD